MQATEVNNFFIKQLADVMRHPVQAGEMNDLRDNIASLQMFDLDVAKSRRGPVGNSSRFRGVTRHRRTKRWEVSFGNYAPWALTALSSVYRGWSASLGFVGGFVGGDRSHMEGCSSWHTPRRTNTSRKRPARRLGWSCLRHPTQNHFTTDLIYCEVLAFVG